jgi:hypothetical protein
MLGNSGIANTYIRLLDNATVRVQSDTSATFKDFTVPTLSSGTWYNLIVVRDTSGSTHVYLNGTASSSGGQAQSSDSITVNQLGRYWDGASGLFFNGKLAEVQFFCDVLSGADITALAAGSVPSLSPVAYLKLNEGTGSTVADIGSGVGAGTGLYYPELPAAMRVESVSTFVSWLDLIESSGTRQDARSSANNLAPVNGVTTGDSNREYPVVAMPLAKIVDRPNDLAYIDEAA